MLLFEDFNDKFTDLSLEDQRFIASLTEEQIDEAFRYLTAKELARAAKSVKRAGKAVITGAVRAYNSPAGRAVRRAATVGAATVAGAAAGMAAGAASGALYGGYAAGNFANSRLPRDFSYQTDDDDDDFSSFTTSYDKNIGMAFNKARRRR